MNREDIESLMRDNGIVVVGDAVYSLCNLVAAERDKHWHKIIHDECEAVIKEEREACAKLCFNGFDNADIFTLNKCGNAIRARGKA